MVAHLQAKNGGGYARNARNVNYASVASRQLEKIKPFIKGVKFVSQDYREFKPKDMIIYCDPPYVNTTKYKQGDFDSNEFWDIMSLWSRDNIVLVSEYTCPFDIAPIFIKETKTSLTKNKNKNDKRIERLYLL